MSKTVNRIRFDLSDNLIHFVRPLHINAEDAPPTPEEWGYGNIAEDVDLSPFFLLRCIIRHGRIWATWSVRGGRPTIYGSRPAVCFTEMPLAAFVQTSLARAARGEKISPYGLVLPKVALHTVGARHVIYGLQEQVQAAVDSNGRRLLPPAALPEQEQYRYVAFDPNGGPDWTHEREWRWPLPLESASLGTRHPVTWDEIPGLEFDRLGISNLGAIVRTREQSRLLVHDMIRLVDQGAVGKDAFRFVVSLEGLPPIENLWRPIQVEEALQDNSVDLLALMQTPPDADALLERFHKVVRDTTACVADAQPGEIGGCWLWLFDNTHALVRALFAAGELVVNRDGRYLVWLDEFDDGLSLRLRETLTKELAERVEGEFGLRGTYFSVLYSSDVNAVPFYCGLPHDERVFRNESGHDGD